MCGESSLPENDLGGADGRDDAAVDAADAPTAPPGDKPGPSAFSGGENGGGSGEGAGHGDDGSGAGPHGDGGEALAFVADARPRGVQEGVARQLAALGKLTESFTARVQSLAGGFLQAVPDKVLVALLSMLSTLAGARYKARRDAELEQKNEKLEAMKRRETIEQMLRKTYADLAAPILKSAAKLAERLHVLVDCDWDRVEKPHLRESLSATYSAYLLGRYLAMVEILKQESATLDYGFPAADRVLANILGRLQGIFGANDEALIEMQTIEHLFQPPRGLKPLRGGPLRITPRAQAVLGELLLRKLYEGKFDFVDKVDEYEVRRGPKAVISFLEFSRLLRHDSSLSKWYRPVIDDFKRLEHGVRNSPRDKRRNNAIGARVYFLQSALLDLVEFFDPLPNARAIPFYRRRRLRLGKLRHTEEQRAPQSLYLLYSELAKLRDHRVVGGNLADRLKLPGGLVEVHVKASPTDTTVGEAAVQTTNHGDCPYSQRVMIVLEELGVPYKKVFISAQSKPAWFYLLHPENRTPVIYHDGRLVEDSKHIVSYLLGRFPAERTTSLGSADNLRLNIGTAAFTRFHGKFLQWMEGDAQKRVDLERELRLLDGTIGRAQEVNNGSPFLGGAKFAREDTAIAPMLNNVEVAGRALKRWSIPDDCKALKRYLLEARQVPSFAKTVGDDAAIIAGYRTYAVNRGERTWQLADMLE